MLAVIGEQFLTSLNGLRNVALPAITLQFAALSELFGGSVLAEQVFAYPGLGAATVQASGVDGTGVTVAVLDSGIDYTHREAEAAPALPSLDSATLAEWRACVQAARARLLAQPDLLTLLIGFVNEKS